jgi:hypothetical protein
MTDMRDFTPSNEIRTESTFIDTGADIGAVKESYTLDDSGGLGEFHRPIVEEESSNRGPILGALAVALMVGAAGIAAYSMYGTTSDAPADQTAAVVEKAPPAPVVTPDAMTAPAPTDTAVNAAPPAPPVAAPEPRTTQQRLAATPRVTTPPVAPTMTPAPAPVTAAPAPATLAPPAVMPSQNQASAVPEAVSPTPPASAVAGTPSNQQSAAPEPEPVSPAAPAEAAPAEAPAQPAAPVDQSQ